MKFNLPKSAALVPPPQVNEQVLAADVNGFYVYDPVVGTINLNTILANLQGFTTTGTDPIPEPPVPIDFRAYYATTFGELPAGVFGDVGIVEGSGVLSEFGIQDVYLRQELGGWKSQIQYLESVFDLNTNSVLDLGIAVAFQPIPFGVFLYSEFDDKWVRVGFPQIPAVFQFPAISEFLDGVYAFAGLPIIEENDVVLVQPDTPADRKSVYQWDGENAKARLIYVDDEAEVPGLEDPNIMERKGIVVVDDPGDQDPANVKAFIYDGDTNSLVQISSGGGPSGPTIYTYGSVDADFRSLQALPGDAPEGAYAVDVRNGNDVFRATRVFPGAGDVLRESVWIPDRSYRDGTGFTVVSWYDGSEGGSADVAAKGGQAAATGDGLVQYQYNGHNIIRLRAAGATDGDNATQVSTTTLGTAAAATFPSSWRVWSVSQTAREFAVGTGAQIYCNRIVNNARECRIGNTNAGATDRFITSGGTLVNEQGNWRGAVGTYTTHTEFQTSVLYQQDGRFRCYINGEAYLQAPDASFTAAGVWLASQNAFANTTSRASLLCYYGVVVVREFA